MDPLLATVRDGLAERYLIEREIGRGGMAVVFAGLDLRHQRRIALKVLSTEASEGRSTERFLREIRVAAGLSHPHILPLYDSGEVAGRLFFVMPLVDGESLRDRLRRDERLPVSDTVRILCEIADAVGHAHDGGIVHRDIKPENILLSHGHALLADFGIARSNDQSFGAPLTVTGGIIGTPEYMSPEQLLGEEPIGPASDIYALGCVLFEMLSGATPFRGLHLPAKLAARMSTSVPSLRALRSDVGVEIERVIARALASQPRDRFATAREFASGLAESSRGQQGRAEMSLVVRPFDAFGDEAELVSFADGLTEEVIGDLSKVRSLRVISRTSAIRLKGSPLDVRSIGKEYDVRYVVTGSVRRSGNRVRVATEIADTLLDAPVWSGKFDGSTDDPFATQEQVAEGIVEALRVSLSPDERRRLGARPIADSRAYECHRKAMTEIVRFSLDGLQRAEALLNQGLAIVGDNAQLFAGMGSMHWQYVNAGFDVREERVQEAMQWLNRALALDPDLADALVGLGWMLASRGDFPGAVRHLNRALAVEPNHSLALASSAVIDWVSGRWDHMREVTTRLQSIDPWELWGVAMSGVLCAASSDREGRDRFFRRAYEIAETNLISGLHGIVCAQDGDSAEAKRIWSAAPSAPRGDLGAALCVGGVAALDGRGEDVRAVFAQSSIKSLIEHDAQWAWHVAEIHGLAQLSDEAIVFLEIATRQGFCNLWMLESRDATLASVRKHPRFAAITSRARENAEKVSA